MTSPYVDRIDLSGKSVFIAGGTSGINLGIAEDFARAGARVAVIEPFTGEGRRDRQAAACPRGQGDRHKRRCT